MPFCQVCLVMVKLWVSVNEACANYQYQTIGKKYYQSGTRNDFSHGSDGT